MAMVPTELHDGTIASTKYYSATILMILLLVHRWKWINWWLQSSNCGIGWSGQCCCSCSIWGSYSRALQIVLDWWWELRVVMFATHIIMDRMEMSWHAWHDTGSEWVHQMPDYWLQNHSYVHCSCNECYCHLPTTFMAVAAALEMTTKVADVMLLLTGKLKLGLYLLCRWWHQGKHSWMVVGRWQCNHLRLIGTICRSGSHLGGACWWQRSAGHDAKCQQCHWHHSTDKHALQVHWHQDTTHICTMWSTVLNNQHTELVGFNYQGCQNVVVPMPMVAAILVIYGLHADINSTLCMMQSININHFIC